MSAARCQLPDRRPHELVDFEHDGIRYTLGIGRFPNGDLAEIFLNAGKHGTHAAINAMDAAIAASLALQHACPLSTLRKALSRNSNGTAAGPLGHALDILEEGS